MGAPYRSSKTYNDLLMWFLARTEGLTYPESENWLPNLYYVFLEIILVAADLSRIFDKEDIFLRLGSCFGSLISILFFLHLMFVLLFCIETGLSATDPKKLGITLDLKQILCRNPSHKFGKENPRNL